MKKLLFPLMAMCAITFTLTSCRTITATQVRVGESGAQITQTVSLVDLEVSQERVKDTYTIQRKDVKNLAMGYGLYDVWKGDLNALRVYALHRAAEDHHCDVIANPTIQIKKKGRKFEIEVVGNPAKYTNWHKATKDDVFFEPTLGLSSTVVVNNNHKKNLK